MVAKVVPISESFDNLETKKLEAKAREVFTVNRSYRHSLVMLVLGAAFGILHSYFFYGHSLGISYPIFILLAIVAILILGDAKKIITNRSSQLWLVPALFFSFMVAVRDSGLLTFLNVTVSFYCLMLFVWTTSSRNEPVPYGPFRILLLPIIFMANWTSTLVSFRKSLETREEKKTGKVSTNWTGIMKGIVISIPLVFIYVALFASGDLVFRQAIDTLGNWLASIGLPSWRDLSPMRLILLAAVAISMGGLFDAFLSRAVFKYRTDLDREPVRNLGHLEAYIPLAITNLIFLSFAFLQLKYALSGYGAIGVEGFTYAEYAKRGYSELSFAAALSFLVIFFIGRQSVLEEGKLNRSIKSLCIGLIFQVGFVIWCAFSRLEMYQMAYGLTMDRFHGYVFLFWMVGAFVLLAWKVWSDGSLRRFALFMAAWSMVVLAVVNVVNPAGYVASKNIGRPADPEVINSFPMRGRSSISVDYDYLSTLSIDAIPTLAPKMDPIQLDRAREDFKRRAPDRWFETHMAWEQAGKALKVGK